LNFTVDEEVKSADASNAEEQVDQSKWEVAEDDSWQKRLKVAT